MYTVDDELLRIRCPFVMRGVWLNLRLMHLFADTLNQPKHSFS